MLLKKLLKKSHFVTFALYCLAVNQLHGNRVCYFLLPYVTLWEFLRSNTRTLVKDFWSS